MTAQGSALPQSVASQLSKLSMASNLMLGMQALTLGAVVIGFVYVGVRLKAIERKIDHLIDEVKVLRGDIEWLHRRHDVALLAQVYSSLESASWAERTGRLDALIPIRGQLLDAETHLGLLTRSMLDASRAHRQAELYASYSGVRALVGAARGRLDFVLDGPRAAATVLGEVAANTKVELDGFQEPMRSFGKNAGKLLQLDEPARRGIGVAVANMKETLGRLESQQMEVQYCLQAGIPWAEWQAVGADDAEPRLLLIDAG